MEKGDDPSGGFLLWFAKWWSHSLVIQVLLWCVSRDRLSVWLHGAGTRLETSSPATAPCTIAGRGLEADPGVGGAGHGASLGWGARGRVAAASGRVAMWARRDGRKEPCEVYKWLNFSRREGKGLKSRRVPAESPAQSLPAAASRGHL